MTEPRPKKKRPLTVKQKKLIKGVAEGKTQKQAAIDAGYSPKCADEIASQQLNKDSVKQTLQQLMEKMGLSDDELLVKHKELLNAKRQVSDGTKLVDLPDYQTQIRALDSAYKLKGAYVEKREVVFPEGIAIDVVFGKD